MRSSCKFSRLIYTTHDLLKKNNSKILISEQEILERNFVFYVIVASIANQTFKKIQTIHELLEKTFLKKRES